MLPAVKQFDLGDNSSTISTWDVNVARLHLGEVMAEAAISQSERRSGLPLAISVTSRPQSPGQPA